MYQHSLRFYSRNLEKKYAEQNMKNNLGILKKFLFFYGSLSFASGMYTLALGSWQLALFCIFYGLQTPLIFLIAKKGSIYFDFLTFFFQISLTSAMPITYFLSLIQGILQDSDSFIVGQAVTYIVQSFNFGSRFYLKALTITINLLNQLFLKIIIKKEFTPLTILWIGSNFIALNYIYWHDRVDRESFLIKDNEKLWQYQIGTLSKLSIITCESHKGKLILNQNQCNSILQEEFSIINIDTFKLFLNSVKLVPKKNFSYKIQCDIKYQSDLQKYLNLYTQINKFSQQISTNNSEFIGIYNNQLYDIRMFTTWTNMQLNIHTFMTKSSIQSDSGITEQLHYERGLFNNYRKKFGNSIKTILVKLNQIHPNKKTSDDKKVISQIYDALRLNYNLQLYLQPRYQLKRTTFLLRPFIDQINRFVCDLMPSSFHLDIQIRMDSNLQVNSCQKTIYQILFNLYSTIVKNTKQSGTITVSIQKKQTMIGSLIVFRISTNIASSKLIMEIQNYQQEVKIKNNYFYVNHYQFGLEMIVSEYLIGKIGPIRRIKRDKETLYFTIFQNLEVL